MAEIRKYATGTTIYFPLIGRGVVDFITAAPASIVAADTKISIDGAASANSTNLFTYVANGICKLVLTAAEMTGKEIIVTVIDVDTKLWEDQSILITTYGNASAELVTDFSLQWALASNVPDNISQANIKLQVTNALTVDTVPELTTVTPSVTTFAKMLQLLHMAIRNKNTTTASQNKIHNAAGTVITTAPIADDGTTFTKSNFA